MFHVKLIIMLCGRFITNDGDLNCTAATDKNITQRIKITPAAPETSPAASRDWSNPA
jgi:hypothetical protein